MLPAGLLLAAPPAAACDARIPVAHALRRRHRCHYQYRRATLGIPTATLQGVHYHAGMRASENENTLNALCARVVTRSMAQRGGAYSTDGFLAE